jgi:hypothetical protein
MVQSADFVFQLVLVEQTKAVMGLGRQHGAVEGGLEMLQGFLHLAPYHGLVAFPDVAPGPGNGQHIASAQAENRQSQSDLPCSRRHSCRWFAHGAHDKTLLMASKVLRGIALLAIPLVAGCAVRQDRPVSGTPLSAVAGSTVPGQEGSRAPIAERPPQPESRGASSTKNVPPPAAKPPSAPDQPTIHAKPGADRARPVPLFRQAIVLANVRAAVAGLPAPPQAEFRQGLLTLKFRGASEKEITAALQRTMEVAEVTRVQVIPGTR